MTTPDPVSGFGHIPYDPLMLICLQESPMKKLILIALMLPFFAGCAIGRKQDYRTANPTLTSTSKQKIAVAVQDRRPDVLTKDVDEDYVGMQRGGYGNPFDVRTLSKQPLALEMAKEITDSFTHAGIKAEAVALSPDLPREAVLSKLKSSKADKSLLVTLREWQSDTYSGTEVQYDVDMEALGKDGKDLAMKTSKGVEQLGWGFWDPQGVAQEKSPIFFKTKMEELYAGDVQKALNSESDTKPNAPDNQLVTGSKDDAINQIEKLKNLLDHGAITQEEFTAKKKQILGI